MWFVGILCAGFLLELWERPPGAVPDWSQGVPSWKTGVILTETNFSGALQQVLCFLPGRSGVSLVFCGILQRLEGFLL